MLVPAVHARLARMDARVFLALAGAAAFGTSAAYVTFYLQGGPKIIDATTYALQASSLARGEISVAVTEQSESFRGRFLYYNDASHTLTGIFPPGYPVVLAIGTALGVPMLVGPVLAALLVWLTYGFAKDVSTELSPAASETLARTAAMLSVVSAALRYHTADTMSHGLSAVWLLCALRCVAHSKRGPARAELLGATLAGLFTGLLASTRWVSALPVLLFALWKLSSARPRLAFFGGMSAPLILLALYMVRVTGSLQSVQTAYYAASDAPARCFAYGFSARAGCLYEHGDFVRANLAHGYGLAEAVRVTLRRLFMHAQDAGNGGAIALLALPALLHTKTRVRIQGSANLWRAMLAMLAIMATHILAYAPFYFDGNYPGGGARFFAELIPLEQILLAIFANAIVPPRILLASALLLFGFHASIDHRQLQARQGPTSFADIARSTPTNALIFAREDDAFNLGTAAKDPARTFARLREDRFDWALWNARGKPPSFLIAQGQLLPYVPSETRRIELESFWPAARVVGTAPIPWWTDASNGRALWGSAPSVTRLGTFPAGLAFETLRLKFRASENARARLQSGGSTWPIEGSRASASTWTWTAARSIGNDEDKDESLKNEAQPYVDLYTEQGEIWLDCLE
jgi:hypothetical protein